MLVKKKLRMKTTLHEESLSIPYISINNHLIINPKLCQELESILCSHESTELVFTGVYHLLAPRS